MKRSFVRFLFVIFYITFTPSILSATLVLSLDGRRTGGGTNPENDRYLTSSAFEDATNVLINAGFTIETTSLFSAANISQADILYTGAVDVGFTSQEIIDIQAFVSNGGGLVIQRDWGEFFPAADPIAEAFGAEYNPGGFGVENVPITVNMTQQHPIWDGPAGSVTSYEQVYSSSVTGVTEIGRHSTAQNQTAIAVTTYGAGRVVFLTDGNAWDSVIDSVSPVPGSNNAIVWENIFHWAVPELGTFILLSVGGLILFRNHKKY